jgi:hypothetical protein
MSKTVTTSPKWSLDLRDLAKGLLLAVLTPVLTIIIQSVEQGSFAIDWLAIGNTALTTAAAYLLYKLRDGAKEITKIQ